MVQALPLTAAAAQGQMVSNSSKSGHTRAHSQSDSVACGAGGDVQAAQKAVSGKMIRQSCQEDGNTLPGALMIHEGHRELERYTT